MRAMNYPIVTFSLGLVALFSLSACTQSTKEDEPTKEGEPTKEEIDSSTRQRERDCAPEDPTRHVLRCFDGDGDGRCPEEHECVARDMPNYITMNIWSAEKDCDDNDGDVWDAVYEDLDGDGYGSTIFRCKKPEDTILVNWSVRSGDCDDTDATIFPGNFRMEGEEDKSCGDWSMDIPEGWKPEKQSSCSGPALALVPFSRPTECELPGWVHPPRMIFRIENWGDETAIETITLKNMGIVSGGLSVPTFSLDLNLQPGEVTPWIERAVRQGIEFVSETGTCEGASHSVEVNKAWCGH